MKNFNRDMMLLLKTEFMTDKEIEQEAENINSLLAHTETPENFCIAHELVLRNRITSKHERLLKAFYQSELKIFCFLINKN